MTTIDQPGQNAATPSRPPLRTAEQQRRALTARMAALYEGREPSPAMTEPVRIPRPIRYSGLGGS